MQEAVEEAFGGRRPEMFVEKLGGYLPEGFDMASCRITQLWVAFMFQCRTFLMEVTREVPLDVFTPSGESSDCRWFSAAQPPPDAHRMIPRNVRWLGLVGNPPSRAVFSVDDGGRATFLRSFGPRSAGMLWP